MGEGVVRSDSKRTFSFFSQGFSYVRVSTRPPKVKDELPPMPKRLVTGTNADLRKLELKDAKQMLREFGVKDDEVIFV